MGKFESIALKNMVAVGRATANSVRLWMRSETAGHHEIEIWPLDNSEPGAEVTTTIPSNNNTDNTHTIVYPDDFPKARPLKALTRYGYRITKGDTRLSVGEGCFETAPEKPESTPEKVSIACMSCHQPFNTDGAFSERSMRMLRLLPRVLSEYDVKFILLTGDQMYADTPENFSLLNPHYASTKILPGKNNILEWSDAEVRQAYQQRYRIFWNLNEVRHFHANYACYPMLDDHEIRDDWGSNPEHANPKYQNFLRGARQAYFDYQGSRVCSYKGQFLKSFHYHFTYGNIGVFVMDIRSERKAGRINQLYSKAQFKDFEAFLEENGDKRVLLIVTSVPVIHIPSWIADQGAALVGDKIDFPDHWSYKKNLRARDEFLTRLYHHQVNHPNQRIVLVSGDVHLGCAFAIQWKGANKPILYQFTSSAISNRLKALETYASKIGPKLVSELHCKENSLSADVHLLKAAKGANNENPFGGLNVGIIEIRDAGDHSTVNMKLIGYPPVQQWKPVAMFESGEL